ncbi:DUF2066 domain-containing protein [Dokdonella sp.]|uniref:DUF2066 domain-containing protein n=1 Tax=Dokdonella sp. TaxID=2291710 RepID=UPI002BB0610A|nr:DUF2066 domain-containing protein [Dokdonella sp.]HOX70252.1 DUF2066 domain-containing protein [Dokdonella sp.]HPN79540.1 DUF2066 domain-containing protein [Dokdonella sp.]
MNVRANGETVSPTAQPWSCHVRMTRLFFPLMILLALQVVPLAAAPTTYSGEAPVASQSEAERAGALKSALAEVVIRLSGDPGILARGDVAGMVAKADKYVLQYRYRTDAATDGVAGAEQPRLMLVAEFDSSAVDRMLAGLGLGGADAPATSDATPVEKRVWISGIHSASDYARSLGYLNRQPLVRQPRPVEARGDGILVRLTLSGDFNRWLETLDQDTVLHVNSASPPIEGVDATLVLSP